MINKPIPLQERKHIETTLTPPKHFNRGLNSIMMATRKTASQSTQDHSTLPFLKRKKKKKRLLLTSKDPLYGREHPTTQNPKSEKAFFSDY